MLIQLNIPDLFVREYNKDRFEESLQRLIADANLFAGNYEKETARFLITALQDSKEV